MLHIGEFGSRSFVPRVAMALLLIPLLTVSGYGRTQPTTSTQLYEYQETRQLVNLVDDAAGLVATQGEASFAEFRKAGSRWRQGGTYIFVVDREGNMVVHPDAALEGRNELGIKDVNGKPIIQGILETATGFPNKPQGWYHYEWPVPGELLPRWKSTYVRLVCAPSGKDYIVASGMYNDRMERAFVMDQVNAAVRAIEKSGPAAFKIFDDAKGSFIAKDAYIFVYDRSGTNLALPAFPNLEGRNLLDQKDTEGKQFIREMLDLVQTTGSGWVDYMFPKPGESIPTQKSAYVMKAKMGDDWVLVGSGVYLANAPKAAHTEHQMTAPELMQLVRDGATLLQKQGELAYPQFRQQGSKWLRDNTYFFVWDMNGTWTLNAADPSTEGQNGSALTDILGRPMGKRILERGSIPSGEGWVHYMYPEPGSLFPTWKSTFVKRVTFPSGEEHIVGCGIYNMRMDRAFIEDVVDRAATLVSELGKQAFPQLRDKKSPFVFMDTYVFVDSPDGTELVNPAQPSLEGKNLSDLKDIKGKMLTKDYIAAAMQHGSAWVDYYWYKPGQNTPAHKQAYVKRVQSGAETYIVGSGLYVE